MTARILYSTNIPSPYMVERFNVIARRADQGLCLDEVDGFIVPATDSDALLDRMRRLAFDPERRSRMGERGYERIRPRTIEWWPGEFEAMVQGIAGGVDRATRVSEPQEVTDGED
jgi:hypothetical protein